MPQNPFDEMASAYDEAFEKNPIAKGTRLVVWDILNSRFAAPDRILDLACGTGEDAIMLAQAGVHVTGTDSSEEMLRRARQKSASQSLDHLVTFKLLRFEELDSLDETIFDGILSNFGGLNCAADLPAIMRSIARLTRPGGMAVLCFLGRSSVWEIASFLARGSFAKAFRRYAGGGVPAKVGSTSIPVWYHGVRDLRRILGPWFTIEEIVGLSILSPPPASLSFVDNHPHATDALMGLDDLIRRMPLLRTLGDHVVIVARRSSL
jgi:ubiquinone/menaquinone biosynthesis C-methylase UbiE